MEAIIIAGAQAPAELQALGIDYIPLLKVGGRTVFDQIALSLREGAGCSRVYIITPDDLPLPDYDWVERLPYSGKPISDMLEKLDSICTSEHVLLSAGDIPLITADAVSALCRAAEERDADVVYPVVARETMEKHFPGSNRTYRRMDGVTVTGGNIFRIRRTWLSENRQWLMDLFARRKNPLALASLLGLDFFVRVLTGTASMAYAEDRLGKAIRASVHAPILDYPELAMDLDKLDDLECMRDRLDPWDD